MSFRIAGLLALMGSLLFAFGDILLPAGKASMDQFPRLKRFARLLSGAEKMVVLLLRDHTEGAGFHIAFLAFFACATATIWNL
ncbi:MAG: hypothetical protein ACM3XO_06935 [Bacteroidota bacterium]